MKLLILPERKYFSFLLFNILMLLFFQPLMAQNLSISGIVKDKAGGPLSGVSVMEKETKNGVTSDALGRFQINVASSTAVLVFSSVGYLPQEILVGSQTTINIVLGEGDASLGEVVVVGYGTQKKTSLTSSVSVIKGEELIRRPVNSLEQALQGQVPGLTILDKGGRPGSSNTPIVVRGVKTLYTSEDLSGSATGPLVLVDGIEQPFGNVNPQDIESISVLKDASSTAIYGSRASNGVMLITTKRAKSGKISVAYSGMYAIQQSVSVLESMDLESYLRLQNLAYKNVGSTNPPYPYKDADIEPYIQGNRENPLRFPLPYDWYNTLFHAAPQTNHTLSLGGGSESFKARMSLRFQDQDGIIDNTSSRLNDIRINTDFKVSEKIKVSADLNYRGENSENPFGLTSIFQYFSQNGIWVVPQYPNGDYGGGPQGFNPKLLIEKGGYNRSSSDYIIGVLNGEWKIAKGLKFSTQYAVRNTLNFGKLYQNTWETRDSSTVKRRNLINNLTESRSSVRESTLNNFLNYTADFGNHGVKALVGYSQIENKGTNISAYRQNFFNNDVQSIDAGTNDETRNNSGRDFEFGLRSYFARLNYAFDDKYFLEVNGRYDGSSRFTGNNQYSFFPSFSAGWRLSKEKFWDGMKNVVNELKLRGSWGKTGNQAVALYSYFPTLNLVNYNFNNNPVQGYLQSQIANPDLTWESTKEFNIGVDVEFLRRRFNLTIDYYNKRTEGILLTLPVPGALGLNAGPQNAGVIENKGVEIALGSRNKIGQFGIDANLNFSINNNNVVDLAGTGPFFFGTDVNARYTIQEGLPIYSFWGYTTNGLHQSDEDAAKAAPFGRPAKAGDVNYVDANNDGIINANDQSYLGNTFPKYSFGGFLNFSYKQFSLNLTLQGAADVSVRIGGALGQQGNFEGLTASIYTNNYWTPENPGARFPRPTKQDLRNQTNNDISVLDASYLRVKNVQLVYQLPSSLTKKVSIDNASVFVSGTNLITFSKLNEWNIDPESLSGIQNYYPQVSLLTFGVNVQF